MSAIRTKPRWLVPFLIFAIAVQGAFTIHYYRTESIGTTIAGVLIVVILLLALWGAMDGR